MNVPSERRQTDTARFWRKEKQRLKIPSLRRSKSPLNAIGTASFPHGNSLLRDKICRLQVERDFDDDDDDDDDDVEEKQPTGLKT